MEETEGAQFMRSIKNLAYGALPDYVCHNHLPPLPV